MKMKSLFAGWMLVCLGLFVWSPTAAVTAQEETKTVAVLSVAGYDALEKGITKEFELAGYGETFSAMTMILGDIEGLDKSQPAAAVLLTDGKELIPFAVLPVADFDALEGPGVENLRDVAKYDAEKGTLTFSDDKKKEDNPLFASEETGTVIRLIEKNDRLYVTPEKFADKIPTDGDLATLLDGLNEKYLIGVKLFLENVPNDLIESLFAPIRQKIAVENPDMASTFEAYGKCLDYGCANFQSLELGIQINQENGDLTFASNGVPKAGSSAMDFVKMNQNPQTLWSDFYQPEGAVLATLQSRKQDEETIRFLKDYYESVCDQQFAELESVFDDETSDDEEMAKIQETLKNFLSGLQEWMMENLTAGRKDSALTFASDGTFMAAATITGGAKLTELIQQVGDAAKSIATLDKDIDEETKKEMEGLFKSFRINASKFEGYTVSTFVVTEELLEKIDADITDLVGISILIGVKDDACILLAGPDKKAVSDLFKEKAKMERTEAPIPEKVFIFSLPELGNFIRLCSSDAEGVFKTVLDTVADGSSEAGIFGENIMTESSAGGKITVTGDFFRLIGNAIRVALEADQSNDAEEEGELFDVDEMNPESDTDMNAESDADADTAVEEESAEKTEEAPAE